MTHFRTEIFRDYTGQTRITEDLCQDHVLFAWSCFALSFARLVSYQRAAQLVSWLQMTM